MGLLLALAGAITFSGKAIIVKLSYRYGVDAVTVIMVRMLWSLPMFVALAWWASRSTHAQANPLQWRDAPIIIALGVLGYSFKWNMGWMHDMLEYMVLDPIYRRYHHNLLTFSMMYTYSENYMLAFSHDEVVHLKKSMLSKMPGDDWQKFANLRVLAGFMFGHPGKKLNFMGAEFGQWHEWNHDFSLDWHLLEYPMTRWPQNL
jgi:hypothetical protein